MVNLTEEEKERGVICCSAGNHAQGVALAARKLGISACIVMPTFTPKIKVNNVHNLGAKVILSGNDFDSAKSECERLAQLENRVVIPPFDDPYIIAGQGTVGMEIARQSIQPDIVFSCVGGGGLISGVGTFLKSVWPETKVIGVETVDANAMFQSLEKGQRVVLSEVGLFADGAAVKSVGEECFRLAQEVVDEMVLVTNDEICAAIKDVFEDTRSVLEPAGALAVAGAKRYIADHNLEGKRVVCVTSGANMNFSRLRFVSERAELGAQTEALMSVAIPEIPGSFSKIYEHVHPRNVTEFSYRYADDKTALVIIGFEVAQRSDVEEVLKGLKEEGMLPIDMSENDLAKDHARYLVGGRSPATYFSPVRHERVYRFTFPERPGALRTFLEQLQLQPGKTWNVTLFHYRNYGSDFGRVLCGISVPPEDEGEFEVFLTNLGYPYTNENDNPVYMQYLRM